MRSTWLSYVPDYLAQEILAWPAESPLDRARRMDVVALFADVSGFTPISEALSKIGKVGAEELTQLLNSYFEPMIDLIESYGGIIGKFGGDAMTVLFPCTRRNGAAVARRAIQCALDMQANMQRYAAIPTSVGTFGLAMKAGLALGPVLCTTVGEAETRLEYIIAGGVLDRCADAEHHAGKGEVVVHNELLATAGPVEVLEDRGGFSCVARLKRRARLAPLPHRDDAPDEAVSTLIRYVHPAIAERLRTSQIGFINEHRKVTVLFVSFAGFDYDGDPQVVAKLQTYFAQVVRTIGRYDGYLNKVDMGDKGSKYVVLFGAPVAHENDEERAIRCALDLQMLGVAVRVGVNTGFVYCGQVGSPVRQEYTVMGDPVNLAARLMQAAAPGQILVSVFTQRQATRAFAWEQLAPLTVKGKAEPIDVYAAQGVKERAAQRLQELVYALPMVGRERELADARTRIEHAVSSRGQVIGITADAGMGKSRLNAEIIRLAVDRGFAGYGGAGQSYGASSPYLAWQDIWRGFFEIDPSWPLAEQARHLEIRLAAIDPLLVPRMPLLGPVLRLPLPDNDLTASFDPQRRTELLKSLLLTCLRQHTQPLPQSGEPGAPLLLVLEDSHWLDPLSQELVEYIGRNLSDLPVLMVVLYRRLDGERGPLDWGARFGHVGIIHLTELSSAEAEQLIGLKLVQLFDGAEDVPQRLIERIAARAQGNPFYLEELINYIRDRGIDPRDARQLQSLDLPDSLHSLIISRIDQLAEAEKTTLKLASVIGRLFRATWLWSSYPEIGAPESIKQRLSLLSRLELTPLDKPEPELEYLFKHITTQEVAYESLAVATRVILHERIASFIERAYPSNLDRYLDVLAFHYGHSTNVEKQRLYFRRAADAARAAYANQAAIDYYQRLLPLLPTTEQVDVLCDLGQVFQLIGQWSEAETLYQQALGLAEDQRDQRMLAQCQLLLGHLLWYKAAYPEALAWLDRARAGFERLGDRQGMCQAIGRMGLAYDMQGDHARALAHFDQQVRIATDLDAKEDLAEALGHLGNLYRDRGDTARALSYHERQLAIATELGNRRESLLAIGNIGLIQQFTGDYPKALAHLSEALDMAAEIGDQYTVAIAAINMGEVYRLQGEYTQALTCYQYGLGAAIELDDRMAATVTIENIAYTNMAQGSYDRAERLFTKAAALAQALNLPYFLVADLQGQAELCAARGDYVPSQATNDEALRIAAQIERKDILFKAQLRAIDLKVALGQTERAGAAAECLALLEQWPEASEQAAIFYALWKLTDRDAYRLRAAELYAAAYARTPNAEYRRPIEELTGEPPPEPPALPPPPGIITQRTASLDAMLEKVDVPHAGPNGAIAFSRGQAD
jgi:adenylate cyclase